MGERGVQRKRCAGCSSLHLLERGQRVESQHEGEHSGASNDGLAGLLGRVEINTAGGLVPELKEQSAHRTTTE